MSYIEAVNLVKIFPDAQSIYTITALDGVSFTIEEGEFVGIFGPSGAGKTTLLSILGGLLNPSSGTVIIDGKKITRLTYKELIKFRREQVGYLWQLPEDNLISGNTVLQNVMLPLQIDNKPREEQKKVANELLDRLGLSHRKNHKPNQISGGEAQRVGLAIAIANKPKLLLGDQITGELDTSTSVEVVNHLKSFSEDYGTTMIIVSHKKQFIEATDHALGLEDGKITNVINNIQKKGNLKQKTNGEDV